MYAEAWTKLECKKLCWLTLESCIYNAHTYRVTNDPGPVTDMITLLYIIAHHTQRWQTVGT